MFGSIRTATLTTALFLSLASPTLWAHPGEHGETGLMAAIVHFLLEHGYLALGVLGAVGLVHLLRSRRL